MLESILEFFLGSWINKKFDTIKQELKKEIMSATERLTAAVNDVNTSVSEGFTKLGEAMEELATDISNLPDAYDVDAEAERLSETANTIREATATFATAIKAALPTATTGKEPEA